MGIEEIVEGFRKLKVLVIGDFFLDKYYIYDPRIGEPSLETGIIPIVITEYEPSPGAAGNVARNVAMLGAHVITLGIIGDDEEGKTLLRCLEKLGITKLKDRAPYRLSEGEKKKVTLASILALDPEIWLMDEPTSSLDPKTQGWIIDFILELTERGKTVITATHDLEIPYVAASSCYVLGENHKIVAQGLPREILENRSLLLEANLHLSQSPFDNASHLFICRAFA